MQSIRNNLTKFFNIKSSYQLSCHEITLTGLVGVGYLDELNLIAISELETFTSLKVDLLL
jgi:hypothetical protein